jgi:hypothetical protein
MKTLNLDDILDLIRFYEGVMDVDWHALRGTLRVSLRILEPKSMVRLLYFCSSANINIDVYEDIPSMNDASLLENALGRLRWGFYSKIDGRDELPDDFRIFGVCMIHDLAGRGILRPPESGWLLSLLGKESRPDTNEKKKFFGDNNLEIMESSRLACILNLLRLYEGVEPTGCHEYHGESCIMLRILEPASIVRLQYLCAAANIGSDVDGKSLPADTDSTGETLGRLVWTFIFPGIEDRIDLPDKLKWFGVYMLQDLKSRGVLRTPESEQLRLLWGRELWRKAKRENRILRPRAF